MKYMGSKNRIAKHILPIMLAEAEKHNITTWVEPFCLHGDTTLFTKDGVKSIRDIQVGDKIYSSDSKLVTVTRKLQSPKSEGILLKLRGNVSIHATDDHLFYDANGQEVLTKDLKVGDSLLTGSSSANTYPVIDLSPFVTKAEESVRGSRGGWVSEDKVRLYHNSPVINRYVKLTPDFCWALGLVIAEGSKASISLHKGEKDIASKFIRIYSETIGIDFQNKMYYERKNSLGVAIPIPKIYEVIFFKACGIGYGARNKSMGVGFDLPPDCFLSLVQGMHTGDGCLRTKGKYFSWNYKTASRTLAKQLQALLSVKLSIKSTISSGINPVRIIEGRTLQPSNYFNVSVNRVVDVSALLDNTVQLSKFSVLEKTKGFAIKEISTELGDFYDITLETGSSHKFIIDGGIVTHNCGGGNMIDKVGDTFRKIGADLNPHTVAAMLAIRDFPNSLPDTVTEEEYKVLKGTPPSPITSWIRFVCSVGGKFENGYARDKTERNYAQEGKRNALKQSSKIQTAEFLCCSYFDLTENITNSLIYCDPPYQGTTGYKTGQFNHEEFFNWCRLMKSKGNIVFVSEYNAPDDFELVWQGEIKTNFSSTRKAATHNAVEKLFKV